MTTSTKENVFPGEDEAIGAAGTTTTATTTTATTNPAPVEQPKENEHPVHTEGDGHVHTPACSGGCIHKTGE
ncbi:hypothetical protein ALI144C_05785 [Actinosynnema sp. ALI-1.44]|uniref:hypothetical protein n=1 Tax=Actinosynnema sp. ALI-1.44 TaxID=1933779 RepID=UPI00097C8CB5|nr:hypothetical protein [Actinosynnema sp. ALI-1.44]ONI89010.1 hypothetical protein ALI144C_05785 [Actinosynnema sp. ALI-1.44]